MLSSAFNALIFLLIFITCTQENVSAVGSRGAHHGASFALTVAQQPVDVDGLTVLCGQKLPKSLQSPHPVSSSYMHITTMSAMGNSKRSSWRVMVDHRT